ncbi:hypothetical protein [Methylobacterium radiodurans]|uniref:Uncharacterized protein n=1 Tax=Methylobacterium radiodurans TaxID=2202828 RepID=A0A2U8VXB1_9HYPH|nr:hypothetical protein [Methylobacterium radiodurans]AWN37900.1 hypothetical protein DK427_20980 [Methylobacterium radiodurans]
MPHGCETETTRRRRRATRPALSAALLSLLAVLSLLLLAGLPATADAEIRPAHRCATAKLRDPACPAQRFAVQVTIDADEPAGESRTLAPRASTRADAHPAPLLAPRTDPVPPSASARLPERPPRRA